MQLCWYRGRWYAREGRKRVSLHTKDRDQALRNLRDLETARLDQARGEAAGTVAAVLDAYLHEKADRPSISKMKDAVKALRPLIGHLRPDQVDRSVCRDYRKRRKASDGTQRKELGLLQAALRLAGHPVKLELPPMPAPREVFITKKEFERLVASAEATHVKTFLYLAWYTAARKEALLSLKWEAVDLQRGRIDLGRSAGNKGRATVPVGDSLSKWLRERQSTATSDYVVEWGGGRVGTIRKGFDEAAKRAGLAHITAHDIRRSAARRMVEAGVPLEAVGQFLGHKNTAITYSTYARFSPSYLKKAAKALE